MIWTALNIILLFALALSFQPEEGPTKHYWLGLFMKVLGALSFGWYYFSYLSTGDSVSFHEKALELYQLSERSFNEYITYLFTGHHPVFMAEGRNDFFVKILSLPYIATQGSYWISSLYLAFFSFLCSWFLYRSIIRYFPNLEIPALIAFLIWPTAIFWSSGIMKDTLVNSSVFFLAGICLRYYYGYSFKFSQVTVAILCLFMLFYMKFYLAALTGICMGLLAWDKLSVIIIQRNTLRYASGVLVLILLIILSSQLNRNMNLEQLPKAISDNYHQLSEKSEAHKMIPFQLDGTYSSMIKSAPKALFTGLFRPAIWQTESWMLFFGLEILMIYLLIIQNILYIRHVKINFPGALALLFILSLATFLPMASPNLGSLVRYKAVFIPFLIFLLLKTPYQQIIIKNQQIS